MYLFTLEVLKTNYVLTTSIYLQLTFLPNFKFL